MKRKKIIFLFSALFFVIFLGTSWFGVKSVKRRLLVLHMEARFTAAEQALRQGQMQAASRAYYGALQAWKKVLGCGGYYPIQSGEYLIAGNSFQQQRQPRAAIECYEKGLSCNPFSISLLTTLGSCAFRLGEREKALSALQKSRSIFPLKKNVLVFWKSLGGENR